MMTPAAIALGLLLGNLPDPVWHHEIRGRWREENATIGLDIRNLSAADRKAMADAVTTWAAAVKKAFEPIGMNIYLGHSFNQGSRYRDAPYYMSVDVMFFRLMSYPRTPDKIEAEDETGRTIRLEINSTSILDQSVRKLGKSTKGSDVFLEPVLLPTRQGFMEYALDDTSRALVLLPPEISLFKSITKEEFYVVMQSQLFGRERDKLEADFAALGAAERASPATALPQSGWPGFSPPGGRRVVRYNGYVFRTRTTRTEPHFATVWWRCGGCSPADLAGMEQQVAKVDWRALPLAPVPPRPAQP
jgi:hypothetical protein